MKYISRNSFAPGRSRNVGYLGNPVQIRCLAAAVTSMIFIRTPLFHDLFYGLVLGVILAGTTLVQHCGFLDEPSGCESNVVTVSIDAQKPVIDAANEKPVAKLSEACDLPATPTNLVTEQAEQNTEAVCQNIEFNLFPDEAQSSDYSGLACFGGADIIENFYQNVIQLIQFYLVQFFSNWQCIAAACIGFLLFSHWRAAAVLPHPRIGWRRKKNCHLAKKRWYTHF